jgi:hypothetical protein
MFIILLGLLTSLTKGFNFNNTNRIHELDSLKASYHRLDTVNVIDVIIDLQKKQLASDSSNEILKTIFRPMVKTIISGFSSIIVLIFIYLGLKKLFPVNIFNWGDYVEYFKKIKNLRNIIFIVIIFGIVVSIIGGLIANKIG